MLNYWKIYLPFVKKTSNVRIIFLQKRDFDEFLLAVIAKLLADKKGINEG